MEVKEKIVEVKRLRKRILMKLAWIFIAISIALFLVTLVKSLPSVNFFTAVALLFATVGLILVIASVLEKPDYEYTIYWKKQDEYVYIFNKSNNLGKNLILPKPILSAKKLNDSSLAIIHARGISYIPYSQKAESFFAQL